MLGDQGLDPLVVAVFEQARRGLNETDGFDFRIAEHLRLVGDIVVEAGRKRCIAAFTHARRMKLQALGYQPGEFDFDRSVGRRNKNSEVAGHGVSFWFETVGVLLKSLRS